MRRAVVISLALLGGCPDQEVAQLEHVKTTVCACKTSSCAEDALKTVPQRDVKSSHRAQRVAREMLDCLARIYDDEQASKDSDPPSTDPETPAPASARTP